MPTSPAQTGSERLAVTVSADGEKVDVAGDLLTIDVVSRANSIPRARLVFQDGDMPNTDFPLSSGESFKPGSTLKVEAGYGQEKQTTVFEGVIIRHGIEVAGMNEASLVVECRDEAVKMTIGRRNENHLKSKDSDIIKKLISSYGLTPSVSPTSEQHEELVQYYCTDWDFMVSRAEANGLLVLVDSGTVNVEEPDVTGTPALKLTYGDDLMELRADMDARDQLKNVKGTSWDPGQQKVVSQESGPTTLTGQGDLDAATLAEVASPKDFPLQTPTPMTSGALTTWVKARQLKSALARIRGRVKFQGSADAKVGALIELAGVGARFEGKVFVTAVRHRIESGRWDTEAEFGMAPDWLLETTDAVAPIASALLPGAHGLQIGQVMKLDESPTKEPMVQVSVPVLAAETPGVWARLAKRYASDGFGSFFIPEIGDEVVLGFLGNDPSHPVVLGSLYSSGRQPPYKLTADNYTKGWVTKSELKVTFDDEKKVITLETPGGNKAVLSDEDKSIVLTDQNNNTVELGSSGISLDSPKDVTITAKGKVTIDATGALAATSKADVDLKGANVNATANIGFTAKGNAKAELSATGQTTVKGTMVMIN